MDLTMAYAIRDGLVAIKKEMEERNLSFDEFLEHYEAVIRLMENNENSCRA